MRDTFTQIFGTSPQELQAHGVDPRRYARQHRAEISQFAQHLRSLGLPVPGGRPVGGGPALFALRFLLVDSFAGGHAAIFWVLGVGGIMLVARVVLFSWLRRRRRSRR